MKFTLNYSTTFHAIQGEKSADVGAYLEESGENVKLTNHLRLVPSLRMSGAIPHFKCFVSCTMITLVNKILAHERFIVFLT